VVGEEVFLVPFMSTQSVDPVTYNIAAGLQVRLVDYHLDIGKLLYTQSNELYIEKVLYFLFALLPKKLRKITVYKYES
jgi:hypothetical protein